MLRVDGLNVRRGDAKVLWDVSLSIPTGQTTVLLGPNGSGKSTVMNSVSRLLKIESGSIQFYGTELAKLGAHEVPRLGLTHVLERRRLFADLTVEENLNLGATTVRDKSERKANKEWVLENLPSLTGKLHERAGKLSGGQQQLVAVGRGLMSRPKFLMLDEPFLGLSPVMVETVVQLIQGLKRQGLGMLFIEQDVFRSLEMADEAVVLSAGRVALAGSCSQLRDGEEVRRVYGLLPQTS